METALSDPAKATTVMRGRRYAFLPFLYDDAAAAVRGANAQYLNLDPLSTEPV